MMPELRYTRGQRTGKDASIAQQDERARTRREYAFVREWTTTDVKTNNYTAKIGELALVDPTDRALAVYFPPAPTGGDIIGVHNASASANNITITPRGGRTVVGAATFVMATARQTMTFTYDARSQDWVPT
jgi:hypothetical protein